MWNPEAKQTHCDTACWTPSCCGKPVFHWVCFGAPLLVREEKHVHIPVHWVILFAIVFNRQPRVKLKGGKKPTFCSHLFMKVNLSVYTVLLHWQYKFLIIFRKITYLLCNDFSSQFDNLASSSLIAGFRYPVSPRIFIWVPFVFKALPSKLLSV
jgi:hypothetical protein